VVPKISAKNQVTIPSLCPRKPGCTPAPRSRSRRSTRASCAYLEQLDHEDAERYCLATARTTDAHLASFDGKVRRAAEHEGIPPPKPLPLDHIAGRAADRLGEDRSHVAEDGRSVLLLGAAMLPVGSVRSAVKA
jgi:hypothetical protein